MPKRKRVSNLILSGENMNLLVIALSLILFQVTAFAGALQCAYVPQLFEMYLKYHYSKKKLNDEVKNHTVEQFIKNLDPSKTMLMQKDVEKLRASLPALFDNMKNGKCTQLDEAKKMVLDRAKENLEAVKKILGDKYKLDESVSLQLDPRKRNYAKNPEEKKELTRKMVHFQISNYLLSEVKLPEAKKNLVHRYELIVSNYEKQQQNKTLETLIDAFAQALDPHSSYLSSEDLKDFQISMNLSLEGIGASLTSQDGFTVIESLIAGGSAERSGLLKPKDKIIAVTSAAGQKPISVIDMDLRDVVSKIRGKKGTKVTLTILRQAEKTSTFDVTLVRDKIEIKDQAAKIFYETKKVGDKEYKLAVLDLPSFYGDLKDNTRSSSRDVAKLLQEAKKEKVNGVLLNLSRNGGGLLEEAVKISGLFLAKANVVATKDTRARVEILTDEDSATVYSGPLAVLTSPLSASASEILAGALRDYHRAVIIGGGATFGKGSVQVVSDLPLDLGALKVTTGMFFLPGGVSTQMGGVHSNVVIPTPFSTDDIGERMLDYALPTQTIQNFVSAEANSKEDTDRWAPITDETIHKLSDRSKIRVEKDPKFQEIRKNLEEAEKNEGVVKLADIRKKSKTENSKKEKDKEKDKSEEAKEKELESPLVKEGLNILGDMLEVAKGSTETASSN